MSIEAKAPDRDDIFLTAEEVASRHRKDVRSLANERSRGEGIPFVKLPTGKILYRLSDVLAAERSGQFGFSWAKLRAGMATFRDLPPPIADKLLEHLKRELAKA